MKMELQSMLEVVEEKINKEEDKLERIDLTSDISYNYHLGKLRGLREVESMLKDLLDE